jgi:hypothetical protein
MSTDCKQRKRQDVSAFKAYVASPAAVTITLPASGRFALRSRAGSIAGATAATTVGPSNRTLKVPALVAGAQHVVDHLERATVVTLSAGFDLALDTGLGVFAVIAEGA